MSKSYYDFLQAMPSATWTISHNLNRHPGIEIFSVIDGSFQQMYPLTITYPDLYTVIVTFSTARAGRARLV